VFINAVLKNTIALFFIAQYENFLQVIQDGYKNENGIR
jgi:hypothetical protein